MCLSVRATVCDSALGVYMKVYEGTYLRYLLAWGRCRKQSVASIQRNGFQVPGDQIRIVISKGE